MPDRAEIKAKQSFIQRITSVLTGRNVPKNDQTPDDPAVLTTQVGRDMKLLFDQLFGPSRERFDMYRDYDDMEADSPIVCSALDAASDAAVSGAEGDAESVFELKFEKENKQVTELFNCLDDRTKIRTDAWRVIRAILKYGDAFQEVVICKEDPTEIVALEALPARSMMVFSQSAMKKLDTEYQYEQWDPDAGVKVASFVPWQVVHYANKVDLESQYGRSMLYQARRTYRQLQIIEDSVVVNRLLRGTMRLVKTVPTPGMTAQASYDFLQKVKARELTRRRFDQSGKLILEDNPLSEETDIFVADMGNGVRGDVQVLQSQPGSDRIADVEYFMRKLFAALRVPPSYIGWEQDTSGTSQIVTVDVAFSRLVRRAQLTHGIGVRQIIDTEIALHGQDPGDIEYDLVYAPMASVDEMRRWQVELLKIQVASMMKQSGIVVDDEYLLRQVLEIEEDYVTELLAAAEAEKKKQEKMQKEMLAQSLAASGQQMGGPQGVVPGGQPAGEAKPGFGKAGRQPPIRGGSPSQQSKAEQTKADKKRFLENNMRKRRVKVPRHVSRAVKRVLNKPKFKKELEEIAQLALPLHVKKIDVPSAGQKAILGVAGLLTG